MTRNLAAAAEGLPFRAGTFAAFIGDAQLAKHRALLTSQDLTGTGLGLKLQALIESCRVQLLQRILARFCQGLGDQTTG